MDQNEVDEFLVHHGVKGMHWGVRQSRNESSSSEESGITKSDHAKLKKAALIIGTVAAVALVAAGTAYVVKNGGVPAFSPKLGDAVRGEKAVNSVLHSIKEEPNDVILATRGKYIGNGFLMKGGLKDPLKEYDKAGFSEVPRKIVDAGMHQRYGDAAEKIAVAFHDPHGRKDAAGRSIVHEVILPKQHADGIDTFDQAQSKAWSLIKNTFDPFYEKSLDKNLGSTRIS